MKNFTKFNLIFNKKVLLSFCSKKGVSEQNCRIIRIVTESILGLWGHFLDGQIVNINIFLLQLGASKSVHYNKKKRTMNGNTFVRSSYFH